MRDDVVVDDDIFSVVVWDGDVDVDFDVDVDVDDDDRWGEMVVEARNENAAERGSGVDVALAVTNNANRVNLIGTGSNSNLMEYNMV